MMQMNIGILIYLLLVISGSFILSDKHVHGRYHRALLCRGGARYGYSDEEAIEFLEENDEEDEELTTPVPTTKATSTENVGVQFMITNKMRRVLEGPLGYLAYEVDEMDPQIASVVIDRALNRPSKGMPESWKRNRRSTDEYNESLPSRENVDEEDEEDGDSRRVLLKKNSMLSNVKSGIIHAKDSILGFSRTRIIPVLPAVFIGVCMYGVAVSSPHIVSLLTGMVEKSRRESMRWIKSVRRAPSSQIKPLKIKICDPGDDNSNINSKSSSTSTSSNKKKVTVPESDSKSKKITPEKVAPPRRSPSPVAVKRTGVDLEALAAAQHLSLWENVWLRMEMFKRGNF